MKRRTKLLPPRYSDWLEYVFDQRICDPPGFVDKNAAPFEASNSELVDLLTCTFANTARDLDKYSNGQLNQGLSYVFNNACSNVIFALMDPKVSADKRTQAIAAMSQLYSNCFEQRCAPVLSHIDEPGASELNRICYMLWDVTPLSYWERQKDSDILYNSVVNVLKRGLDCRNIACVESALHGLGHIQLYRESQVTPIVRDFIKRNPKLRPELKRYAEDAAIGYVQ